MSECHPMVRYSEGFEYVISFLDFKPDPSKVLYRDHLAFVAKPIACPRNWGFCSFKDLSIYIVPRIPSVSDGDGVFDSWFDSEWAFDCHKFRGEGEVCIESI